MMAQSSYRVRSIGDYVVGKQIGSGSYSVVWHARHKVHGTDVAIKEIPTGRLNKKLEECLMSEIDIMRNINHPNIIRLHEMIKEPGKIHLVLEYCRGGDLAMFIHRRQGRIPESTAVHFMQQLAAGLKILRENQIIHRDLKPQNLLLSSYDDNSTLKIADFGFARSLQPRGLAETLCGSPLYMAPEIMQLQKYDAKADLWSVGAILFQIVTGRTPFTGINQIQLLQNIMKSTELQFPPNVKDLSYECIDLCRKLLRQKPVERLTFEDFFSHPFFTRQPVEFSGQARPRSPRPLRVIDGFKSPETTAFKNKEQSSQEDNLPFSLDDDSSGPEGPENHRSSEEFLKESLKSMNHRPVNIISDVVDSLELIDQDYVLVSGPLGDASCSSASVSKLCMLAPKPAILLANGDVHSTSAPCGTLEKLDLEDGSEKPSSDLTATIKSLQHCASAIGELVNDKFEAGQHLEAFSIQLVILAIWKQTLHICHTQAVSALEGSIERIFLGEVEKAEILAKIIEPGNVGMPDAMEIIFQAALTFGRHGAVDECMGYVENAASSYSKAACLLSFLLVEAPSLNLNPPFSITRSDCYRLRTYIDVLNNRQRYSRSQRMALLNGDNGPLEM